MINQLISLLGYSDVSDLPYFGEDLIFLFCLILIFFGSLAFFSAVLNIIFGLIPSRKGD